MFRKRAREYPVATTNHDRVGKAMELLKGGLGPFVEREFKSTVMQGPGLLTEVVRYLGEDRLEREKVDR